MALFTIENVTIIVVVVISIIFATYLLMLKKMGWLARNDALYRCPNKECRKIFKKPSDVKDLSAPSRVYPACPECGFDLGPFLALKDKPRPIPTTSIPSHQKKPDIKISDSSIKIQTNKFVSVENSNRKPLMHIEQAKPNITFENPNKPWNTSIPAKKPAETKKEPENLRNPQESNSFQKTIQESKSKPKAEEPTLATGICSHYFGYLHTLQKGAEIPYQCYFCSKMIDCYKI
jgi:hypothetical protein